MNTKTQQILAWSIPIVIIVGVAGYIFNVIQASQARLARLSNLRGIDLAILTSCEENKRYPEAIEFDENGKPKHSWRARIAKFMGDTVPYDFAQSWDSPTNKAVIEKMPVNFSSNHDPDHRGITNYFAVTGPGTAWEAKTEEDRNKNYQDAILLVEIPDSSTLWTEPRDLTFQEFVAWWKSNRSKYSKNPPWVLTHVLGFQELTDDVMEEIIAKYDDIIAKGARENIPTPK